MDYSNMFGANPNLLGSGMAGQDINQLTGIGLLGSTGNDASMLNPQSQQMANQGMYQMPQAQQFDPMMMQGLMEMMKRREQDDQQQQMPPPAMPIQIGGGQFSGMYSPRGLL